MNILAIDPSLRSTGYAILFNSKIITGSIKHKKEIDKYLAIISTCDNLMELINKYNITSVILEDYAFAAHGNAVITMGEVSGNIRVMLKRIGIDFSTIAIPTWKKLVLGYGNLNKKEILKMVKLLYNVDFKAKEQDQADAYCILQYAINIL